MSIYLTNPNVPELTTVSKVSSTTRPIDDLAQMFDEVYNYKQCLHIADVDNYKASTHFLATYIDSVLQGMDVQTLIEMDDEMYRDLERWECAVEIDMELCEDIHLFPDWQLDMASRRLRNLSRLINEMECVDMLISPAL